MNQKELSQLSDKELLEEAKKNQTISLSRCIFYWIFGWNNNL